MSNINWKDFESPYFKPEKNEHYNLVLGFWRQEWTSFDEGKTQTAVLTFDVLNVNGKEYFQGVKTFSTTNKSFIDKVKPLIIDAENNNLKAIYIDLVVNDEKKYMIWNKQKEKRGSENGIKNSKSE